MPDANNLQIQEFIDTRLRTSCADICLLVAHLQNHKANESDIYQALITDNNPGAWSDSRQGPPHLCTPADFGSWNTFVTNLLQVITGPAPADGPTALALISGIQGQWPVIQKLPINPVPQ